MVVIHDSNVCFLLRHPQFGVRMGRDGEMARYRNIEISRYRDNEITRHRQDETSNGGSADLQGKERRKT